MISRHIRCFFLRFLLYLTLLSFIYIFFCNRNNKTAAGVTIMAKTTCYCLRILVWVPYPMLLVARNRQTYFVQFRRYIIRFPLNSRGTYLMLAIHMDLLLTYWHLVGACIHIFEMTNICHFYLHLGHNYYIWHLFSYLHVHFQTLSEKKVTLCTFL